MESGKVDIGADSITNRPPPSQGFYFFARKKINIQSYNFGLSGVI